MNPIQSPTKDKKSPNLTQYKTQNRRKLTARSGKRCQCMACEQYFNTSSTFDAHRVDNFGVKRFFRGKICQCLLSTQSGANTIATLGIA
jgi:hypothetical protein